MSIKDEIVRRYNRAVIAFPDGSVVHDGDCNIYRDLKLCSCGLHHMLIAASPEVINELYPKFYNEETNETLIVGLLRELKNNNLYVKVANEIVQLKS